MNFANEAGRAIAHGAVQGTSYALQGGSFGAGFAAGAVGSFGGSVLGQTDWGRSVVGNSLIKNAIGTGVFGGIGSVLGGGSFGQGFESGLMISLFNHEEQNVANAVGGFVDGLTFGATAKLRSAIVNSSFGQSFGLYDKVDYHSNLYGGAVVAGVGTSLVVGSEVAGPRAYAFAFSRGWVGPAAAGSALAIYGQSSAKILHIFDNPEHQLEPLVQKFGSREAAFDAVHDAAQQLAGQPGVATRWIDVSGIPVWVRGVTVNGMFRIGTFSANTANPTYPYHP